MIKRIVVPLVLAVLIISPVAYAALPDYYKSYPAFSIAPVKDSPLVVELEELLFQVDEQVSERATVTAKYTLTNPGPDNLTVPLILPFIAGGLDGTDTIIKLNERVVESKVYSAGQLDRYSNQGDYLMDAGAFKAQVDINNIIANLNRPPYRAVHFDEQAETALYEITFVPPAGRQSQVSFTMDNDQTWVLIVGFPNFSGNPNTGEVNAVREIKESDIGERAYLLVLGEDTLSNVKSSHADTITRSEVEGSAFIRENLMKKGAGWIDSEGRDFEELYNLVIEELDYSPSWINVTTLESALRLAINRNDILVLWFTADFPAESENILTLTYPLEAAMDRSETRDYVNIFSYIFDPARKFNEHGGFAIRVELNSSYPFIIESSLPFTEEEPGIYTAAQPELPEGDLVFTTYSSQQVTRFEHFIKWLEPRLFWSLYLALFVLIYGGGTLLVIFAVVYIFKKKKK